MNFEIITPEKVVFKDEVDEIIVITEKGQIAILPNHIDLLTRVVPGELIIKKGGKESYLAVTSGFLEIRNNNISLLADHAIRSEEINAQKALEAQRRAEELLKRKEEGISDLDFAEAQAEMRRAILQLKISKRRHGHPISGQ